MFSMRFFFVCVVVGDFVFVVGGYDNIRLVFVFVEWYDLVSNIWEMFLRMYIVWDECVGVVLELCW